MLSNRENLFPTFIVDKLKSAVARVTETGAAVRIVGDVTEVRDDVLLSKLDISKGNHLEIVEYSDINDCRPGLTFVMDFYAENDGR